MTQKFIIVDDDYINNEYNKIIIELAFPEASIYAYTDPEEALRHIQSNYVNTISSDTFLFLDINMPTLTGWEFLDAFERFSEDVKNQVIVYMLSSSVDPRDRKRAADNKIVVGYLEKPLTEEIVNTVVLTYAKT